MQRYHWLRYNTHYYFAAMRYCKRRPLLAVLQWAGQRASFTLPDGRTLQFYDSVVGYGVEALLPAFTVFVLLCVLTMRDYADPRETKQWERLYLTHWWRTSVSNTYFSRNNNRHVLQFLL
jgi:hypothetical protein